MYKPIKFTNYEIRSHKDYSSERRAELILYELIIWIMDKQLKELK